MGTIVKRRRKGGGISYTAQIRIKKGGVTVYSEAETFHTLALAKAWRNNREVELKVPGALERLRHRGITVGKVLADYLKEMESARPLGRTKREHLKLLGSLPIADQDAIELSTDTILEHLRARRRTAGPSTVLNDLIWLRVAMRYGRDAWGMPLALDAVERAAALARGAGLVAKPRRRERRVTDAEIRAVLKQMPESTIPMADIVWFALHSARRLSEITGLRWADLDRETHTGIIRNVKHPRRKVGNDRRCKFPKKAWEIIERQPETAECVFPYKPKTVGTYFTKAVYLAGIEDLHFHDLRHEAASRLFERGHSIQEVQLITLHESWAELRRYTHLRPEDVPDR